MNKILIAILAIATVSACTSKPDAVRALTAQGFTDISITGHKFFACGEDDFYSTGFVARNSQGKQVNGVVCSGLLFKSATIRF